VQKFIAHPIQTGYGIPIRFGYGMNSCTTLAKAEPMPQLALCGLFVPGLIPALRHGCMGAEAGPVWGDLSPCVQHALGRERILNTRHAASA